MKNIPEKIFLCIGDEIDIKDEIDFNKLDEVLWSVDGINNNDIEYILKECSINWAKDVAFMLEDRNLKEAKSMLAFVINGYK